MDNIYGNKLLRPDVDFGMVRDGRRSPIFHFDVDLGTARSIAAGTHAIINLAGDSFYADLDPVNQGEAVVHFEDVNLGAPGAPIYVTRGQIVNTPFTRLLVENTAQPGKRMRFFYGVGLDFKPGASSTVTVNGTVSVTDVAENESRSGISFFGALAAGAVAGQWSSVELWNPAGSGVDLILTDVISNAGGAVMYGGIINAAVGAFVAFPRNKRALVGADPTSELRAQFTGAAPLAIADRAFYHTDAGFAKPSNPIILLPGTGYLLECNAANTAIYAGFQYRRESA
jgi:hypothetical protein